MHLDLLNRPIKPGDTILTKGYNSCTINELTTVASVTKAKISVRLHKHYWGWDPTAGKYQRRQMPEVVRMYRLPKDCIVIDAQIACNRKEYPELQL